MNSPLKRAEEIVDEALDLAPEERAAHIEKACGQDAELRQLVEGLLRAHKQLTPLSQETSTTVASQPTVQVSFPLTEKPGDRIGRYKLLQRIGEGTFGVVYMAEQEEPVRRRVALKVLKLGMDTKQVIARFEAERQALALMDHPNIAKVLDGGATNTGRLYFVMELVKGIPIARYCDENKLDTRQRLELFIQVCQAIQHAHQKGIIHRDIKPSNILAADHDGVPVPKVIDFGIAKATAGQTLTNKTLFTAFEQFIGTPAYMSPEQAKLSGLDIDTRSDIYSLGVMLYELLTGATPFESKKLLEAGFDEIRRIIREVDPPRPSTRLSTLDAGVQAEVAKRRRSEPPKLLGLIRGDLDWIVMKCLEKDRNRRYETASGLSTDIQRHLNYEPVLARPPTATYRLKKLARKHRAAVGVAAGFVLLLALATAVSSWLAVRASSARRAADRARKDAYQKAEAEARAKDQAQAVLAFFQDKVLSAARPQGQEGGLAHDVTLRAAIDAAEPAIARAFSNQPVAEASVRDVIGTTYRYLGDYTNAIIQHERALYVRKAKLGPDHPATLSCMNNLANVYSDAGRLSEALPLHEETLRLRKAKLGPDHPETLGSMNNLASAYRDAGRLNEALALHEETLKHMEAKLGPDHPDTLRSMDSLASAYLAVGRLSQGLALKEETLKLSKAKLGSDHPDTLGSMANLAIAYGAAGRLDESLALHQEAFKLTKAKLGPDHPDTLTSMNNLAAAYRAAGRGNEALALYEETLKLRKAKLGPDHPDTLRSMDSLAGTYQAAGLLGEALPLHEETLKLMKAKLGPDHPDTLRCMNSLASAYRAAGRLSEALQLHEETLKLMKAKLGPDHPGTLRCMKNLADAYRAAGRTSEALALYDETLKLMNAKLGPDHPETLVSMNNLANAYHDAGRGIEALALCEETLKLMKAKLGPDHPATLVSMNNLASAYGDAGRLSEALQLHKETLKLTKAKLGPDHPHTLASMNNLANAYRDAGRTGEALQLYEETLKLMI